MESSPREFSEGSLAFILVEAVRFVVFKVLQAKQGLARKDVFNIALFLFYVILIFISKLII